MKFLGAKIAEARKDKKLSQRDLAKVLGVAKSTVGGYEAGSRNPDPETLLRIAEILDVSTDYLLGHKKEWIDTLSPELQRFVIIPENHVFLHVAKKLKDYDVPTQTIIVLIEALAKDARHRLEARGKENSP